MIDHDAGLPTTLGLVGDALAKVSKLVGSELQLARTEVGEKITAAIVSIVAIVTAAVFLIVALIFFLQGLVATLVKHGWRMSLASYLVGAAISIVAMAAIVVAKPRLTLRQLAPGVARSLGRSWRRRSRSLATRFAAAAETFGIFGAIDGHPVPAR